MKIKCSLNEGLDSVIERLETYQKNLNNKSELFVRRLADVGINVAMTTIAFEGMGDAPRDADFGVEINGQGSLVRGFIRVSGSGLLFWEFGAGNYYNGMKSPNPKASKFGMGIGTYPGQKHVPNPGFWYYYEHPNDKKAVRSYGTQATMPVYKATLEIIEQTRKIAKEVFV